MNKQTNKEFFITTLMSTNREGMSNLIDELDARGFFNDPASAKYHSNYPGGLVEHSILVYKILMSLCKLHKLDVSRESIIISSLLHDVVKAGSYKVETRNIKNDKTNNQWKSYICYGYSDSKKQLAPHGVQSIMDISKHISLSDEEQLAIIYHMGEWSIHESESFIKSDACKKYPLILLLHHADMQASYIQEKAYDVTEIPFTENISRK